MTNKRMVLINSDMAGEDLSYTIGAIMVPNSMTTDEFQKEAVEIVDGVRKLADHYDGEYYDDDILQRFVDNGYEVVGAPEQVTVLQ